MLIVITNPTPVANEAGIINALFDEGMELLHLRKPEAGVDEIRKLMEGISSKYHHQIALHQHHEMADEFETKRLHFTEAKRKEMSAEALTTLKEQKYILSTSIHQQKEYKLLPPCFDYAFFGPVFNSISKTGYTSVLPADFHLNGETSVKQIAIGGIDERNIKKGLNMGFAGIAVLGALWQNPQHAVSKFKQLKNLCN